MSAGSLTCEVIADIAGVTALSAVWDALLDRSVCNRAFGSSAWFIGACRADPALSPHLVIARRGGDIVGVLPLALNAEEQIIQFPSRLSDYNDAVVAQGDIDTAVALLLYAKSEAPGYDRALLTHLRDDSNCVRAMETIGNAAGWSGPRERAFHIPLDSGYQGYLRTRSRQFRKGLAKALRRAADDNITAGELNPSSFAPSALPDLFLKLHLKRFAGKTQFELPSRQSFVREVFPVLFAEGRLKAFVLFDGPRIVAIDLCMQGADSLCSWSGGFLPEAASWSPGTLLTVAEIQAALALGLAEYDFLRGSEAYKQHWASVSRLVSGIGLELRASEQPAA